MSQPGVHLSEFLVAILALTGFGGLAAWSVSRWTMLSAWNWYLASAAAGTLLFLVVSGGLPTAICLGVGAVLWVLLSGSFFAHRLRGSDGRGGGELRDHELARQMFWRAWRERGRKPRTRIARHGELVVERKWDPDVAWVPLGFKETDGRVPRGEGRHILVLGGTGSGKTVSADRIALGRVAMDRVPALVLDPKGDERLIHDLGELADFVGRPFVVFDPMDAASDRWDPLWSAEPGRTVARIVSPIQTSEPYYADTLRVHLGVVAEALQLLGLWPASVPLLLEAAQAHKFEDLRDMVRDRGGPDGVLRRVEEQHQLLSDHSGKRDIASGASRLRIVVGESWRPVLTPRADGRAVQLPTALRAGAIVLWRTWVEDLPEEAEAITTLALADIIAAAAELRGETEWLVLLDEFGSVMEGNAARRALGMLGRARSAGGQAIVVTQSAADVPSATGNEALRESLADNFSAFVVHRQTSAESREWVSKLMGTRELWASTDRTVGGGRADGTGSRRRVREFRVRPDSLKELGVGEAYVWVPNGGRPEKVDVAIPEDLPRRPAVSSDPVYRYAGPRELPPVEEPKTSESAGAKPTPKEAAGERPPAVEQAPAPDGDPIEQPRELGRFDDDRV